MVKSRLTQTLSTIAKKIKWPENKSVGFEGPTRKDKYLNPLLTTPPRSPKTAEDFDHRKLGHWNPFGLDYTTSSETSDKCYYQGAPTASNPTTPITPGLDTPYYYLHEAFTILTFSIVICIWFYIYGFDRESSSQAASSSQTSSGTVAAQQQQQQKSLANNLELRLYNALPLRVTSSLWGKINSYDLPIWMRSRLYDFFCKTYNCDMSEALESDYRNYRNLSEFFSRRLKPDSRPISVEPGVVSPADGLVLHFGPIMGGRIEGVKGLNYSVQAFLGLPSNDYEKELTVDNENNELYNCIIYLAPGDYHRFHSPANWLVNYRKHFPGRLLSVRPSLMKRMPEVLHINERVCYAGSWPHGFFSMTAVGATNVGSIKVNFDEVSMSLRGLSYDLSIGLWKSCLLVALVSDFPRM